MEDSKPHHRWHLCFARRFMSWMMLIALWSALALSACAQAPASTASVSTSSPAPSLGVVKLLSGAVDLVMDETLRVTLKPGESLNMPLEAQLLTMGTRAEMLLPGDVRLFQGATSALTIASLASDAQPSTGTEIGIVNEGYLLISGRNVSVQGQGRSFKARLKDGVMGIRFQINKGSFIVDCITGDCGIEESPASSHPLQGGQQGMVEGGQLMKEIAPADYGFWLAWSEAAAYVPALTPTPTITPSPTPTETPTPQPTNTPVPYVPPPVRQQPTSSSGGGNNPSPPPPAPTDDPSSTT